MRKIPSFNNLWDTVPFSFFAFHFFFSEPLRCTSLNHWKGTQSQKCCTAKQYCASRIERRSSRSPERIKILRTLGGCLEVEETTCRTDSSNSSAQQAAGAISRTISPQFVTGTSSLVLSRRGFPLLLPSFFFSRLSSSSNHDSLPSMLFLSSTLHHRVSWFRFQFISLLFIFLFAIVLPLCSTFYIIRRNSLVKKKKVENSDQLSASFWYFTENYFYSRCHDISKPISRFRNFWKSKSSLWKLKFIPWCIECFLVLPFLFEIQ